MARNSLVWIALISSAPAFAANCATCSQAPQKIEIPGISSVADATQALNPRRNPRELLPLFYENFIVNCSVSRYHERGGEQGGSAGHKLIYIKGACRVPNGRRSEIQVCPARAADRTDRNAGVTLSVDKQFKNTRFIATDGIDTMFGWNVAADESLTREKIDRTVDRIVASGASRGIELHEEAMANFAKRTQEYEAQYRKPFTRERFVAETGIGTNYAISFARSSECTFVPISKSELEKAVAQANALNSDYANDRKIYQWNGIADNCTHFTDNLMAGIGIGHEYRTSNTKLGKLKHLGTLARFRDPEVRIPVRSLVQEAERITARVPNPDDLFADRKLREHYANWGTLPQRPGGLVGNVAFHSNDNEVFLQGSASSSLSPVTKYFRNWDNALAKLLKTPHATSLETNLETFVTQVSAMESQGQSWSRFAARNPKLNNRVHEALYNRYWAELQREKIASLSRLRVLRGEMTVDEYRGRARH